MGGCSGDDTAAAASAADAAAAATGTVKSPLREVNPAGKGHVRLYSIARGTCWNGIHISRGCLPARQSLSIVHSIPVLYAFSSNL